MLKWHHLFLIAATLISAVSFGAVDVKALELGLPEKAEGTFVQRKHLADVDVTLVSKGTYKVEKGKSLEWNTATPVTTSFRATPEEYTVVSRGKTVTRKLSALKIPEGYRAMMSGDLSGLDKTFAIEGKESGGGKVEYSIVPKTKEALAFVKKAVIVTESGYPRTFRLDYANGDTLEIELTR